MEHPRKIVERLARERHAEALAQDPGPQGVRSRPRVKRWWGPGRGKVGPSVRIAKDEVRIDSEGRQQQWTATLADYREGLPPEVAAALPAAWVPEVQAAIRTLLDLPCDCGTWTEGSALRFMEGRASYPVPDVPVDWRVWVSQCTVCHRAWTFERQGDSHYGYSEQISAFGT